VFQSFIAHMPIRFHDNAFGLLKAY